jgi:hypothetical protein
MTTSYVAAQPGVNTLRTQSQEPAGDPPSPSSLPAPGTDTSPLTPERARWGAPEQLTAQLRSLPRKGPVHTRAWPSSRIRDCAARPVPAA